MSRKDVVEALIEEQGTLFSEEIGANIARDEPVQWFHWLLAAMLMSARISAGNAVRAARGLKAEKLHKVETLLYASRKRRISVLNANGYARFDNVGADQIRTAAELAKDEYGGDLRKLRDEGGDAKGIETRLTDFVGIGPAGAAIFSREAQLVWDELYPTADKLCLETAEELGLPADAEALSKLAGSRERFVRLLSGLARAALDGPAETVEAARG